MNTVKQVCLGVAMAGVIAGAGSATATAVAYADATDSGSNSASGDSPSGDTGHGGRGGNAPSAPKTDTDTAAAQSGDDADNPTAAGPRAATSKPGGTDNTPKKSRTPGEKVTKTTESATSAADTGTTKSTRKKVTLDVPVAKAEDATTAPAVKIVEPAAEPAAQPAVDTAPTLSVATPVTPAPDPIPLPLPLPALPATPATSNLATAAATTSRSRTMSTSAGDAVSQITAVAPTQHVLVIGIDGVSLGRLLGNDAGGNNGAFLNLLGTSTSGASSIQGHTTISNPSWTTMLTGVWDTKSGVINNIFNPQVYNVWHTVFDRLESWNRSTNTKAISDWDVIDDIASAGTYGADHSVLIPRVPGDTDWSQTDTAVTTETVNSILGLGSDYQDVPNFLFSYLVQVDEAGHAHGGASTQYTDALTRTDENLRLILQAVADREATAHEDWTVLVVTDHGHQPQPGFGHGFQTPTETTTFVVADGFDFGNGKVNLQYSIADVTPTILSLFGAPLSADFDGVPLTAHGPGTTPVNGVKDALKDAVADIGYPDFGTQVRLSVRTIFASIPYFLNQFTDGLVAQLQTVANQGIFLISTIAAISVLPVQFVADVLFQTTNVLGNLIGLLTGAGVVGPSHSDPVPFLVPDNSILV